MTARGSSAIVQQRAASTRRFNGLWQAAALPLLLLIALPLIALILRVSPERILENLNNQQVLQAIQLSLFTASVTVLVSLLLGTPVAYLLARCTSRIYRLVDILIDLPTVLPPAVAGVALLVAFGRRGLFGIWLSGLGLTIPYTTLAVIIAQTFIASPLYVRSAAIGFAAINREINEAAALDGASPWQTFRYLILPLSKTALITGAVLTWSRALGEFGATIIFAGNFPGRTQTMPLAIYLGFELELTVALTLSVILIGFSVLTLLVVKGIFRRQMDYPTD